MCRQDEPASCLYVLISGRIRLIREDLGMRPRVRVEEEVGRGEAVGAVWALTGGIHDTTALCVRDSELVRMSKVRAAQPLLGGIYWMIACLAMLLLCSRQVCTTADAPFHMRKIPGKRSSSRSGSNMFHDPFGNHIPCPLLYSTITTCICVLGPGCTVVACAVLYDGYHLDPLERPSGVLLSVLQRLVLSL